MRIQSLSNMLMIHNFNRKGIYLLNSSFIELNLTYHSNFNVNISNFRDNSRIEIILLDFKSSIDPPKYKSLPEFKSFYFGNTWIVIHHVFPMINFIILIEWAKRSIRAWRSINPASRVRFLSSDTVFAVIV